MKNKIINIKKEFIKKKLYTKKELKYTILKSIVQNQNIQPIIRIKASKLNNKKSNLSFLSKQKNNICLKTGRIKGVYNQFNFSRHYLKYLGSNNNLQNIKIASW